MTPVRLAADRNLHLHMRWVQERTPGMRVEAGRDLLVVDSGLATDSFNFVGRARLPARRAARRVADAVAYFRDVGRPFSWWLGLTDEPEGLGDQLERAGLHATEAEVAMAARLDTLHPGRAGPRDLVIERVRTTGQLAEYARLLSELAEPADERVLAFYRAATPALLSDGCPLRLYLGRLGGRAVSTAEMTLSGSAAGLYNISTAPDVRRRGIGLAMTLHPLLEARRSRYRLGVLQAAPEGVGVYRRAGLHPIGRYVEYHP